jgi:hypothetical protein
MGDRPIQDPHFADDPHRNGVILHVRVRWEYLLFSVGRATLDPVFVLSGSVMVRDSLPSRRFPGPGPRRNSKRPQFLRDGLII